MFRSYSAGNCMLLALQCHESGIEPEHVAGFRTWLKLDIGLRLNKHWRPVGEIDQTSPTQHA